MNKYEKILHVAFVDYYLLLEQHETVQGYEFTESAHDILDKLIGKFVVMQKNKLEGEDAE